MACKTKHNSDEFFGFIGLTNAKCNLLKTESFSNMLVQILAPPISAAVDDNKRSKKSNKVFYLKIYATEADLKFCRDILNLTNSTKIHGQNDVNQYFMLHVMKSVCKILEDIYMMKLEKLEPQDTTSTKETQIWKVQ